MAPGVDKVLSKVRVSLAPGESVSYATSGNLKGLDKRRPVQAYVLVTDRRVIFTSRRGSFLMDVDLGKIQGTAVERQPPRRSNGVALILFGFFLLIFSVYSPIKTNELYTLPFISILTGITMIAEAKPTYVLTIQGADRQFIVYSTQRENVYGLDRAIRSQLEKTAAGQGKGEVK